MMFFIHSCILITILSCVATLLKGQLPISKSCHLGDIAENECNKCICTLNGLFECNSKRCNETGIDNNIAKQSCHPNRVYVRNLTVCICKTDGLWPHEKCKTIFKSLSTTKTGCEPNSYAIIDCNVCKCGPNGTLDKNHCTRNKCDHKDVSVDRRFIKQNQVYGSCEAKNWYSLAPCQFCYCVSENKLICNTGNIIARKLHLGSYNLSVCGKDLIKDAISLIPDGKNSLRFGNDTESNTKAVIPSFNTNTVKSGEDYRSIELNREHREKKNNDNNEKKMSEEYYSESDEVKPIDSSRIGLSTNMPLPYEDDENDVSDDENHHSEEPEKETAIPKLETVKQMNIIPLVEKNDTVVKYPQHFEWKDIGEKTNNLRQLPSEGFNLGDVLKPYLPVVLDKVFQMALRKSMVSVDAHADCTPGSTTMYKCNACFCMKNNKLLCTNNTCS